MMKGCVESVFDKMERALRECEHIRAGWDRNCGLSGISSKHW